jgi:hypothetical protein
MERPRFAAILMAAVIMVSVLSAHATPVTYNFQVKAASGPLVGMTAAGTFTFDDSVIANQDQYGYVQAIDLLTDLNFTWNGIAYDESTANTGWLGFDANGELDAIGFGNHYDDGVVFIDFGTNEWCLTQSFHGGSISFAYTTPGADTIFTDGVGSYQPVPEPATMLLLASGLMGLAGFRRRLRRL